MSDARVATLDDLAAIVELDRACFSRPWTRDGWRAELSKGAVLVSGAPIVALACAPIIFDHCELRRIAVAAVARRTGQGRSLLEHIIDSARAAGCLRLELEASASNSAAIALYGRCGFEVVGRRRGYYRDPPDDAILMSLALE